MTFRELHELFASRTDALCEDKPSSECDCNKCPCALICSILCSLEYGEEVPEQWARQLVLSGAADK